MARNHRKILGGLFVAWAVLQALGAAYFAIWGGQQVQTGQASTPIAPFYWVLVGLFVVAYALAGAMLLRGRVQLRFLTIALSVLALFSFPIGTALGAYGLWVMLRRPTGPRDDEQRWVERHA